jgi:hypothetical protein
MFGKLIILLLKVIFWGDFSILTPGLKLFLKLELQIVSEMLRVNTGSSCVFHSRLLGSLAVFRIVMRATNEGH